MKTKHSSVVDPSIADLARFGTVPRDVRLTATGRMVIVVAIGIAAVGVAAAIGLPIVRAGQQAERELAAREGTAAEATITRMTRTKGDDPRHEVTYRYAVAGAGYEKTVRVSEKQYRASAEGGRLAITYLRSRPSQSWLAGRQPGMLPLWLLPLLPLALLFLAASIAWRVRRDCVLLAEGRFAPARVIASKKVSRSHGQTYEVQYEFKTLSGATVTRTTDRTRPVADAGAHVTVVYHRENPRWNAIYPLALAAPDRP